MMQLIQQILLSVVQALMITCLLAGCTVRLVAGKSKCKRVDSEASFRWFLALALHIFLYLLWWNMASIAARFLWLKLLVKEVYCHLASGTSIYGRQCKMSKLRSAWLLTICTPRRQQRIAVSTSKLGCHNPNGALVWNACGPKSQEWLHPWFIFHMEDLRRIPSRQDSTQLMRNSCCAKKKFPWGQELKVQSLEMSRV